MKFFIQLSILLLSYMHKNFEIELKKHFSLYLTFSAILHFIECNLFIAHPFISIKLMLHLGKNLSDKM